MKKKNAILMVLLAFCLFTRAQQISVVSVNILPYNITPEAMLDAALLNNGNEAQVQMISKLYNQNNELLLTVSSNSFTVKPGLNDPFSGGRKIVGVDYSTARQSEYIKTTHTLPGGVFKVCISILLSQTQEPQDEFCDDIESDFNQYLYLVNPFDKDTIETLTPMLSWSHSEPFSALAKGEYYRMILSEIKKDQQPDEAISVNAPLMVKNYLNTDNLQYPYDAKELKKGGHYAWEVVKMSNDVVTAKTETWEFVVRKDPDEKDVKYVALKPSLTADLYTSPNGKIFFKFIEEYKANKIITAYVISDKGKEFPVSITNDQKNSKSTTIKSNGDNRFVLDLDSQNIKPGYYHLEIRNEKKETFYLKFYLPE